VLRSSAGPDGNRRRSGRAEMEFPKRASALEKRWSVTNSEGARTGGNWACNGGLRHEDNEATTKLHASIPLAIVSMFLAVEEECRYAGVTIHMLGDKVKRKVTNYE
ncbi:hypothetical protein Taro_028702, partial [Colocasia esculenta]|nr:hypothetical protein [Colocasia esculenta]